MSGGRVEEVNRLDHSLLDGILLNSDQQFLCELDCIFESTRAQINMGEATMKSYIEFCKTRSNVQLEMFAAANNQFR